MSITNGLVLPSQIANGSALDATVVMANYNALLAGLNRALLASGTGMNAFGSQIHNLGAGTASTDAANVGQLTGLPYLTITGGTLTGPLAAAAGLTAPTVSSADSATNAATTAFVQSVVAAAVSAGALALLPPGALADFAMQTAPTGWLECTGAAVSRTTYAALFAAIGVVYGAGDGSTTFNLPDMRGNFRRGWDHGAGVDAGRAFGSLQLDAFASHTHSVAYSAANQAYSGGGSLFFGSGASTTGSTGGTETRPRNLAVLTCIKT